MVNGVLFGSNDVTLRATSHQRRLNILSTHTLGVYISHTSPYLVTYRLHHFNRLHSHHFFCNLQIIINLVSNLYLSIFIDLHPSQI